MHEGEWKWQGIRKCMRETVSPRGRQEVRVREEVQEGDRKWAYWKGLSEGTRSIPEPDPAMGIWNK